MKKRKKNKDYYPMIITFLFLVFLGTTIFFVIRSENYKSELYKMCRQFNLMAYLAAENIRHYQNATFEYSVLPDCEVYKGDISHRGKLTYDEWLIQNNMTHIEWNESINDR
jgi:hypothetical protein